MSIKNPHVNDHNPLPIPIKFKTKDTGPTPKKTKNILEGKK